MVTLLPQHTTLLLLPKSATRKPSKITSPRCLAGESPEDGGRTHRRQAGSIPERGPLTAKRGSLRPSRPTASSEQGASAEAERTVKHALANLDPNDTIALGGHCYLAENF